MKTRQPIGTRFSTSLRKGEAFFEWVYSPQQREATKDAVRGYVATGLLTEMEAEILCMEIDNNTWGEVA